jgi:Tfp pilus assembly pilus retraction ATPase PilT
MKPSLTIPALPILKYEDRRRLRDMTIPLRVKDPDEVANTPAGFEVHRDRLADAFGSTGHEPVRLFDPTNIEMMNWFINIYDKSQAGLNKNDAFAIDHEGQRFRAKVARRRVEGNFLELRSIPEEVPHVSELLGPPAWGILSLDPAYLQGGLILITGAQGAGKTTNASAIVASRGLAFGGQILTIENPPEYPLNGWWGKARCFQSTPEHYPHPVTGLEIPNFSGALQSTLREFHAMPAGGTIIFVGEILDEETAAYTLLASSLKHCVVATSHGETTMAALDRICQLAGATNVIGGVQGAWSQLANNLKLCINQTIDFPLTRANEESYFAQGQYDGEMLWIPGTESTIANALRARNTALIREVITAQTQVARRTKRDASLTQVQSDLCRIPNVS